MIDLGPHAVFIIWAYIGVLISVFDVIAWTLFDARATARQLATLEACNPRQRRPETAA
ncbi:MAG: heme exporter protein CcmD [Candidatus Devosia symbiotica]|nr:heme exporter protein CcmD [Candidatus Devosia symbiotica]